MHTKGLQTKKKTAALTNGEQVASNTAAQGAELRAKMGESQHKGFCLLILISVLPK